MDAAPTSPRQRNRFVPEFPLAWRHYSPAGWVSLKQARSELDAVATRLHREDPSGDVGFGVFLQTLNDAFTSDVRPALLMLMGCVGLVLLIACANVANLLLARGSARPREMAVRTALGASPWRLFRQLLTESVLLAGVGGAAGVAISFLLLRGMLAIHPPQVPRIEQTGIDGTVLAYSLLASVVVGILFGLAPAIEAARIDINDGLHEHCRFQQSRIWASSFHPRDRRNCIGLRAADLHRAGAEEPMVLKKRGTRICSEECAHLPHRCAPATHRAADLRVLPPDC